MRNSVIFLFRGMLIYINNQQLHHKVSSHDTWRSSSLTDIFGMSMLNSVWRCMPDLAILPIPYERNTEQVRMPGSVGSNGLG